MPFPLLIVSQSDYSIQVVYSNSHTECLTVQIQIRWLLKKPIRIYIVCKGRVYPDSAGPEVKYSRHIPDVCVQNLIQLKVLGTLGRYSAMFYKGANFCGFLFAFPHIKSFLRKGNSKKGILPFEAKSFFLD